LKKSLYLTGGVSLLFLGGYLWHQQSTIERLQASQVVVSGPVVVKSQVVAKLVTQETHTDVVPFRNLPRVVYGPFGGEHTSETVSFDLAARVLTGYRQVEVVTIKNGDQVTIRAKLSQPEVLGFEPQVTPVKFEENGWVQAFEFGRKTDAGDFITKKHAEAAAALRKRVTPALLAEASAHAEEALRKMFPKADKIVIL
jgi:hypothetical protein